MKNEGKSKYLFKNTALFAIGNFASKFISLFLVPLYTNCMVAAEYGTADLLYTLCNFLIPLFTLNISEAVLRFSLDKDSNQKKILKIASTMIVPLALIGLVSIPVLNLIDGFGKFAPYFYMYMLTAASSQIFLVALKGQEKLKKYTVGNILHTFLIALFNIVLLLCLNMGVTGYFVAYIIANIIMTIYGAVNCGVFSSIKDIAFDKKLFKQMTKYSVILIPTTFMWWIMNFLDRVMISGMMGVSESGIYAVSYKIPTILSSVSSIFMQAWLFSAIKNDKEDDNEEYTNNVFRMLCFVLIATSLPLLMLTKWIFGFYVAPEYFIAWEYVPSLMIGHIFLTLSTFVSTSYNVNKDSKGHLKSATVGAVMNLILNAILIPLIGVQGAAIATTISYISVFVFRMFDTRKYLKMHFTSRMLISTISVLAVSVALFLPAPYNYVIDIISILTFTLSSLTEIKSCFGMISRVIKKISKKNKTTR